ncbi:Pr6Pr family membrane protein [Nocardia sp. XZ_19_385]|uniref:Pr6Pr family membrane protein n=1 Tax=Nocardia sp. XZ_19_385 TaxID=2769488 RepID=UPI00188E276E|nr:Pr6Pr family membrane protein [Nocardia sp. XZ_19_385]
MTASSGTPQWIRGLRIAFGVLSLVALAWIPLRNLGNDTFSAANYFSYFTIQSNIFAMVVLLIGGLRDPRSHRWQVIRGAATLYMVITGIVYAVLLANIDVMLTDKWINVVEHRVMPIVLLVDWLLVPVALARTAGLIGSWLLYPLLYGVYSLVRGPIVDWYPYPFLDPREQGYGPLTVGLVVLTAVFVLLALAVVTLGAVASRWRQSPAAV